MAKESILTLDIGSHGLKLAEFAEVRGNLEMTKFATAELGIDPQSDTDQKQYIITTIHDLLRESGCKPGPVNISIAGHSVFSRFVKLPPCEPEKVQQIIQYEAQQNVPFPMNEVVWDYQLVTGKDGDVDVMLAAIKSELIDGICDCATFAGLRPELIDVAPMALYNAVRYNYDQLPPCTLVIDIGARSTDLIFVEEGRIFSRNVPVAGNQITQSIQQEFGISFDDAEAMKKAHAFVGFGGPYEASRGETVDKVSKCVRSMMTRLHQEVNRSINFYRGQQGGKTPELILLTGGSSMIPYTDTFLKEKLKIETDYFNPFNNVAVAEAIEAEQVAAHASEMGALVGLALRKLHTCPVEINLLPPKAEEEKRFKGKLPYFFGAGAAACVALLAWALAYQNMGAQAEAANGKMTRRVQDLERQERALTETEAELANRTACIERLLALEEGRVEWRGILQAATKALPDGMWITHLAAVANAAPPPPSEDEEEGRGRRRRGRGDEPPPPPPVNPKLLKTIEIAGMGYLDAVKSADEASREYRDRLRASPMFSDETEITYAPPVGDTAACFEFKIRACLEEGKEL